MINQKVLNSLFKPYKLKPFIQVVKKGERTNKRIHDLDVHLKAFLSYDKQEHIQRLKDNECSKSKNRSCGNIDCEYNLLKYNYFDDGDVI